MSKFKLYDAQQVQLDKSHPNYYYIMKMGTGKTVVGLSHVMKWFPNRDVIVIAPRQVVKAKSWERDAELVGFKNGVQVITTDGVKKLNSVDIQSKVLIVDEAHKFKNKSARSKKLNQLTKVATGYVFLSGTPTNDMSIKIDFNNPDIMSASEASLKWGKADSYVRQMLNKYPDKFPEGSIRKRIY